ncbi:Abortive infection protein AbiEi [Bifidobacterium lemurum]|nr:Abortive infection protein AbiEi [Bifidobacterium lemurum]
MEKRGFSRTAISQFAKENNLQRVARGLYHSDDSGEDPLFELQHRYPKAIFSHETALFLLDEAERVPSTPTITIPQSASATRLSESDVIVRKVKDDRFEIGLSHATTMFGHSVRTYDWERTICDLFRSRSTVESQDLLSAFRNYMRSSKRDLTKLTEYAAQFRLTNVMRPYLEAVMTS